MDYRIGSFNACHLSAYANKEKTENIAKIINDAHFDIIALQEVSSSTAVSCLKRFLLGNWQYRWEASPHGNGGYAFLWNADRMELSYTKKKDNIKRVAEPHIYKQYKIDRKSKQQELVYEPYYGRFKPKNSFCEIRLINTHLRYGIRQSDGDVENNKTNKETFRKNEFKILTEVLFPTINYRVYGNNLPAYTILLGDYNLNLKGHGEDSVHIEKNPYLKIDNENRKEKNGNVQKICTFQDELTTLKRKSEKEKEKEELIKEEAEAVLISMGINPEIAEKGVETASEKIEENNQYVNNYDHFTFDEIIFDGVKTECRRIDTVKKYFADSEDPLTEHINNVSDHVPIVMDMTLNDRQMRENKWKYLKKNKFRLRTL